LAKETPPGTEALGKLFELAGGSVLILCDEVLNYINRYRGTDAEKFFSFIDNLVRAMTSTERCAAVISLPRSQVEMSDYDLQWQEKINKVVRRVAKDLISNDEAEISEVVRKRLFEDLGSERIRKNVAKAYADWCFERRNQLPPEWTAVDTAATDAKRGSICDPDSRPAIHSIRRRFRSSIASGRGYRNSSRLAVLWRCSRNGFPMSTWNRISARVTKL
jgi:hypothetical protein